MAMAGDSQEIMAQFYAAVNMSPARLDDWLKTPESQTVGQKPDGDPDGESIGHESGRRILELLRKDREDLTEEDLQHMQRVISYVHRHLAQRPQHNNGELATSRWRFSLMNWGHDPLVDDTFVNTQAGDEG